MKTTQKKPIRVTTKEFEQWLYPKFEGRLINVLSRVISKESIAWVIREMRYYNVEKEYGEKKEKK